MRRSLALEACVGVLGHHGDTVIVVFKVEVGFGHDRVKGS